MRALFGKAVLGPVAGLVLLAGLGLMVAPDPARLEQVRRRLLLLNTINLLILLSAVVVMVWKPGS